MVGQQADSAARYLGDGRPRAWGLLCALRRSALAAQARPQSQCVLLPSAWASVAHLAPFDFAGPAETLWDGGMFQVELVFPPDFPDAPPYVHFLTPMFHPHISPLGVPYLRSLIM